MQAIAIGASSLKGHRHSVLPKLHAGGSESAVYPSAQCIWAFVHTVGPMQQVSIASSSVARHLQMEWLEWMKDSRLLRKTWGLEASLRPPTACWEWMRSMVGPSNGLHRQILCSAGGRAGYALHARTHRGQGLRATLYGCRCFDWDWSTNPVGHCRR